MKINLDKIEANACALVARSFRSAYVRFTPDVVLTMVARIRSQERAIRFLWDKWADAEGGQQPSLAVFGDAEVDEWRREQGIAAEHAPTDVQAVIREVLDE